MKILPSLLLAGCLAPSLFGAVGNPTAAPLTGESVVVEAYASAIFSGAAVTLDDAEKEALKDTVREIKQMGRWHSVRGFWLLGSDYNAGTGTTLYELTGITNGTLVNSPTWGTAGITFNGSSQYVSLGTTFTGFSNSTGLTALGRIDPDTTTLDMAIIARYNSGATQRQWLLTNNVFAPRENLASVDATSAGVENNVLTTDHVIAGIWNPGVSTTLRRNKDVSNAATNPALDMDSVAGVQARIGAMANPNWYFDGVITAVIVLDTALTGPEYEELVDLLNAL